MVSTGKMKFQGQLTQFVNMELSRCNARSQCRSRQPREIAITWYLRKTPNSLSGEFQVIAFLLYMQKQ